jgi:hypothetical protein
MIMVVSAVSISFSGVIDTAEAVSAVSLTPLKLE